MDRKSIIKQTIDTPWKIYLEALRIILHPFVMFYLRLSGVQVGKKTKWYGFPRVFRHRQSQIIVGDRVEVRNWLCANPLGINHPLILTTWSLGAVIHIANDVGVSGGIICANKNITIGKGTLIGANSTIIDTDFHPINSKNRRYNKNDIKSSPVNIGKNVFIGTQSIILKGVNIGDNAVVGAGSVVSKNISKNSIFTRR